RSRTRVARISFLGIDLASWLIMIPIAAWLRYEFDFVPMPWGGLVLVGVVAAALQAAIGLILGVYRGRHVYGTFEEVKTLTFLVIVVGLATSVLVFTLEALEVPRSTALIATPLALLCMLGARYVF